MESSATQSGSRDPSPSPLPLPLGMSRKTSHCGNRGGLGYGAGVFVSHIRPFLPFFLISCLVVVLVYLLQTIVYGGPFTDPLFFAKFDQRWPKSAPAADHTLSAHPAPTPGSAL